MQLTNGDSVAGIIVRSTSEHYELAQPAGANLIVPRADVVPGTNKPLGLSLMPPGLLEQLTEKQRKDLLTFLLTVKP